MSKTSIHSNSQQQSRTANGPRKKSNNHNDASTAQQDEGASSPGETQASKDLDSSKTTAPSRKRLYVSNLKWQITEDRLREEFSKFGQVTEARVVRDRRSGWSRGFGFVSFGLSGNAPAICQSVIKWRFSEAAMNAMEALNGTELEGRLVRIEFARSSGPQQRQTLYNSRPNELGDDMGSGGGDLQNGNERVDYTGLDPGYCVQLGPPYTAYIPAHGQYIDTHLYYPSAYYQPNPIDLVVHQMQMMGFDPTTQAAQIPPHYQRQQKASRPSSTTTSPADGKEREDVVGEQS